MQYLKAVLSDVYEVKVSPLVPHPETVALAGHGHGEVLPGYCHLWGGRGKVGCSWTTLDDDEQLVDRTLIDGGHR